jgi:DNA integrity scanning protein DisA with diadenylate cyclase activity
MLCQTICANIFLTEHVSPWRSQRLADEARLCIQDCGESFSVEEFNEELRTAKVAVDVAGVSYSELLEELALTPEGVEVLNEVRKLYAPLVDSLRHEFNNIGEANIVEKLK